MGWIFVSAEGDFRKVEGPAASRVDPQQRFEYLRGLILQMLLHLPQRKTLPSARVGFYVLLDRPDLIRSG